MQLTLAIYFVHLAPEYAAKQPSSVTGLYPLISVQTVRPEEITKDSANTNFGPQYFRPTTVLAL